MKRVMIIFWLVFCIFIGISCSKKEKETESKTQNYFIKVTAKPISDYKVEFKVDTNIPLPVEVMASIDLKGLKPEDPYIGYSQKITLKESPQIFVLNVEKQNLPSGNYIAEVVFYPRWGAKNGNPKARKINKEVRGASEIFLVGSGEKAETVLHRKKLQKWVMENVIVGTSWNENKFVKILGNYEELVVSNRNPNIIKAFYFPEADITIFVNVLKQKVVIWRIGRTSEL